MWYVYLTFEVSWTDISQNIEFSYFPLFLIFAQMRQIQTQKQYIARIANAVQCHNLLSGNKDCHESRFSIVSFVISVSNIRSPYDCSFRVFSNGS